MIYYFSGTGNTKYVAGSIASKIGEESKAIARLDASNEKFEGSHLGFMFPIYSWGVPPIMLDFIKALPDSFIDDVKKRKIPVWMVCTCGDETGEAPQMFQKAIGERGLKSIGFWSVIMPNTYILLPGFDVDLDEIETYKIDHAPKRVAEIASDIQKGEWRTDVMFGPKAGLKTKLIYPLFKKWGINPRKWNCTQECISCGKCAGACPVGNVKLHSGRPVWGKDCVSCLACYHICPTHAIEYGRATSRKGQYRCPLKSH